MSVPKTSSLTPHDPVAVALTQAALDVMMPLHLTLSANGDVAATGPTLRKLFPETGLIGRPFLELFEVRRPGGVQTIADLRLYAGLKLMLVQRGFEGLGFAGVALPAAGGSGLLINLSFGIGIIDAVRGHGLTDADFAATDLAMELLYLVEAKSAVTKELRALNLRLQGAKRMAEAQAQTDTLTGLSNRRALDLTMADAVRRATPFGLMHIDLDYFKEVNDTLGHAAGDHVLREVARVLGEETRRGDTVARIGGDEFVMVFPDLTEVDVLAGIADRLVTRLSEPFEHEGRLCHISASIGISVSTAYEVLSADQILGDADEATYASKRAGRGQARFHDRVNGLTEVSLETG